MSEINCKTIQKEIPLFLAGSLEDEEALRLICHIEGCSNCKEELQIQKIVSVSLDNLDNVSDLDVNKLLRDQKKSVNHSLKVKDLYERAFFGFFFVFASILAFIIMEIVI